MELVLASRLLPVPHGFSTRDGGVSEGALASLNAGFSVGDAPDRVRENLRRIARAVGVEAGELHTVSQVHGDRVLEACGEAAEGARPSGEADALWTDRPGAAVGVKTADCVPILLVDPDGRRVAAVHSGWRGTEKEIVRRAVELLVSKGARPERLLAAVGPSIRICCYVVSPDLGQKFRDGFGERAAIEEAGEVHLDLVHAIRTSLGRAGLVKEHVDVLPHCTACDARRFYSHRRDRGVTGRHLSLVACRF